MRPILWAQYIKNVNVWTNLRKEFGGANFTYQARIVVLPVHSKSEKLIINDLSNVIIALMNGCDAVILC